MVFALLICGAQGVMAAYALLRGEQDTMGAALDFGLFIAAAIGGASIIAHMAAPVVQP